LNAASETAPRAGGRAWIALLVLLAISLAATGAIVVSTVRVRFARDVARAVFNDNVEALELARAEAGAGADSLRAELAKSTAAKPNGPYIVVSIADHRVWYKQGDSVLFTAPVATGSGKTLVVKGASKVLHFDTPRGRLIVQRRDSAPMWVPPDWHYQEQANRRGGGLVQLERGAPVKLKDGGQIEVVGNDVVRRTASGTTQVLTASEGKEIVADGRVVIPPYGTNQRKYPGVLGDFRLYLGDGYGLHGTDEPKSIGRDVSHGCVRMRNEDIRALYERVTIGTPVYIY